MAFFGGGQNQVPVTGWCDYCGQKPKFPPYNYCGKACGSKAKGTRGGPPSNPALCKQCGQRPVHKGHQFCGRKCANTWQAMSGQINTGGHAQPHHAQQSWNPMPPAQMQNPPAHLTQPFQGLNQGAGIKGIFTGLKGLIPQSQQPQQQYAPPDPSYVHQVPGHMSPNLPEISPPISPVSSGAGGTMSTGTPPSPGLGQQYYSPSSPTSPEIQDLDTNDQINGQHFSSPQFPTQHTSNKSSTSGQMSKTMSMAVDSPTDPTGGGDFDYDFYPDEDPVDSLPPSAGGHGNGNWDPSDPNHVPSQQSTSTSFGSSMTCRLKGCQKPVFVDPVTHHQSEYCSQRHREEAKTLRQVSPCIMCRKMPRGLNDHFCSRACRDKALTP